MKKMIIAVACLIGLSSCNSGYQNQNQPYQGQVVVQQPAPAQVVVTPVATNLGDGLSLQAGLN